MNFFLIKKLVSSGKLKHFTEIMLFILADENDFSFYHLKQYFLLILRNKKYYNKEHLNIILKKCKITDFDLENNYSIFDDVIDDIECAEKIFLDFSKFNKISEEEKKFLEKLKVDEDFTLGLRFKNIGLGEKLIKKFFKYYTADDIFFINRNGRRYTRKKSFEKLIHVKKLLECNCLDDQESEKFCQHCRKYVEYIKIFNSNSISLLNPKELFPRELKLLNHKYGVFEEYVEKDIFKNI